MGDIFTSHSYLTLFMLSFLASTIVPMGSEWFLVMLVVSGYDPMISVAVATVGNTLGACTTYIIGLYGGPFLIGRVLRISKESIQRAERLYGRYGSWSLFFSWVPLVGDPLCLVGGVLRVRFGIFFLLVSVGKLARYVLVASILLPTQSL